ncbi:MAG TPA: YIP1 family protein [Anaerolineales bacterium]|nr:YIP1 family protein [Anaerolineales bacterium]
MNMNMPMSSAPTPSSSGGPKPFFQVWIDALTKPNEQTFADMASSPNAKAMTAYIWVFVGLLVEFFFSFLVNGALVRRAFEQQGMGGSLPGGGIGIALIGAFCGGPIFAVIGAIIFAIFTALIQWVAKMFGGTGTNDQLAYTFGAIATPFYLISTVFVLLGAIPFVGFCFRLMAGLLGLYALVLYIMASKGVNKFGWGQAAGSVLIPGLAIGLVCCCVVGGVSMAVGAGLKGLLQQFQQGGTGY